MQTKIFYGGDADECQRDYDDYMMINFYGYVDLTEGGVPFKLCMNRKYTNIVLYAEERYIPTDGHGYMILIKALKQYNSLEDAEADVDGIIIDYLDKKVIEMGYGR